MSRNSRFSSFSRITDEPVNTILRFGKRSYDDEIAHGKTQVLSSLAPKEMELYTKIYMEHKQYHTIATELQLSLIHIWNSQPSVYILASGVTLPVSQKS